MNPNIRSFLWSTIGPILCFSSAVALEEPASHPTVAAFERFFRDPGAQDAQAGRLLLGELSCASCHKAEDRIGPWISNKRAPILSLVGSRVRVEYLRDFIRSPESAKPGSTMPNMFSGRPENEVAKNVEALVHFLASTGSYRDLPMHPSAIDAGAKLYHESGCVACHGPRDGKPFDSSTSVPLEDPAKKYSLIGLAVFLKEPALVRPSGRMPSFNLDVNTATDLASFLLKDLKANVLANMRYRYFEGSWEKLPDFSNLKPVSEGETYDFYLGVGARKDNTAIQFEGFVQIDKKGEYTFTLASDDGSRLLIDGQLVVDVDGVHPTTVENGKVELEPGAHKLGVDWFNGGGEAELKVELEGPGIPKQPATAFVSIAKERPPAADFFKVDEMLAARGRELFGSIGCASCHELKDAKGLVEGKGSAFSLAALRNPKAGCLAEKPREGTPVYNLDARQKQAIAAALEGFSAERLDAPKKEEILSSALYQFNCFQCHARSAIGGVEKTRDVYFVTTQKEMGDEGRLPPSLDGVGAKLTKEWLAHILSQGAKDRPYMLTKMPRFGEPNVGSLAALFEEADRTAESPEPAIDLPERKVKSIGRFLVGSQAFGCGSCHSFKGHRANGIQAIDMSLMTKRLNRSWFAQYVVDPQKYRPGTRMPSSWPRPESALKSVLDGKSAEQIAAVWRYLSDGDSAATPVGLDRSPIPIVAAKEAVIYRNFIQGAGPRAIGVGYPERANIAFDANELSLALIWQGDFIDASRHRSGRGEGFEPPLGDNIVALPTGPSFARLTSPTAFWPKQSAREDHEAYQFLGYRLTGKQRLPSFRYRFGSIAVEDLPQGQIAAEGPLLLREIELENLGIEPVENAYFRAALGGKIETDPRTPNAFKIDGVWTLELESDAAPIVRQSDGKSELIVPIKLGPAGSKTKIVERFRW